MRPDRLLLQDMLEAIEEVLETTPGRREDFDSNKLVRSHLLRNIQIVGEAAVRISKELKDRHPEVPWRLLTGMRHVIVHDYFEIDWNAVYDTSLRDVPSLKPLIVGIVAASSPGEQ